MTANICPFLPKFLVPWNNFPIWTITEEGSTFPSKLKIHFFGGMIYIPFGVSADHQHIRSQNKTLILLHTTKSRGDFGYIHNMLKANKSSTGEIRCSMPVCEYHILRKGDRKPNSKFCIVQNVHMAPLMKNHILAP